MDIIRIAIGGLFFLLGIVLLFRGGSRFRKDHWHQLVADLATANGARLPDVSEKSAPEVADENRERKALSTKRVAQSASVHEGAAKSELAEHFIEEVRDEHLFVKGTFAERPAFNNLTFKISRGHLYDLSHWGGVIAGLIYLRVEPLARLNVGTPLATEHFAGNRFENIRKLMEMTWVRVFVDEYIGRGIQNAYNLDAEELATKIRGEVLEHLEGVFSEEAFAWFGERMRLDLFERDWRRATAYQVDFFPLPKEKDQALTCEAYLQLASDTGQIAMPMLKNGLPVRFSDREYRTDQGYLPLEGHVLRLFQIGPHPSCHIQTFARSMGSTLTLGWRPSNEMGVAGQLEIHDVERGSDPKCKYILRYQKGSVTHEAECKPGTQARLRNSESGNETTFELWRRQGDEDNPIANLVVLNPKPRLDDLPDCCVFDDVFSRIDSVDELARFIASQIYFASKNGRNQTVTPFLEDDQGQAFLERHGEWKPARSQREPLRCRVRLCVSGGTADRLRDWLGDRGLASVLAEKVKDVFRNQSEYNQAIPNQAQRGFQPGEGTPGLTITLSHDEALAAEAALVRCQPVFVPFRRREIFGRLSFESWAEATDLSGISCRSGRTFFTDYPQGKVALHLSRFPVYEIQVPRVFGAVRIHLLEPGTPKAELKIENRSNHAVIVDGKRLNRPHVHTVPLGTGTERRVRLEYDGNLAELLIYAEPRPQLDEPDFVPEAARLEFAGLGLCRRGERQGLDGPSFRQLWSKAQLNEGIHLLGASLATPNGYLVSVERGASQEIHFLSGKPAVLYSGVNRRLEASDNTLDQAGLPANFSVYEKDARNIEIRYQRYDLNRYGIRNARILLDDYWERWADVVQGLLPEGMNLARIELAACPVEGQADPASFLYMVEAREGESEETSGWLFQPQASIRAVHFSGRAETLLDGHSEPLIGPLPPVQGKLFAVDWSGGAATPVSFDVEDHDEQVRRYLSDGWFSLPEDAHYSPGGNLAAAAAIHRAPQAMFVANESLHFRESDQRRVYRPGLSFDPREYANFFDKDAYRVFYDSDRQAFAIASELHRKEAITPKSVFLVVPEGGRPILGSHALPNVVLPPGINWIVLPGLVFKFSQGPVYYG